MPLNGRFPFPDINFTVATPRTRSLLGYVDLQLNPRADLSSALECIVVVDRGEEEARFENRMRDSTVSLRTRNQRIFRLLLMAEKKSLAAINPCLCINAAADASCNIHE